MEVVVPCDCGTRFSFEVEPVNGKLPAGAELLCPTCQKDGVPLANRVIGESLRKDAAEKARVAATVPAKKSLFARPEKAPAAAEQPRDWGYVETTPAQGDDVYTGPNKVRGMIGAVVGGVLGAAAWASVVYITGYEIRYVAIGVGALVGLCSRKFGGGRDYHVGLFATACALLAILVGQWFAANAFIKTFAVEIATKSYERQLASAKGIDQLKTDADIRRFLANRDSDALSALTPAAVDPEDVNAFKQTELPKLKQLLAGEPTRENFIQEECAAYVGKMGVKDIFIASITPYLFLWVFLGIGAAWKLASDYGTSVE